METNCSGNDKSIPVRRDALAGTLANPPVDTSAGAPPLVDVSVCIVTFQAREMLRDCLRSLAENTRCSYEVIVTDNGSSDGTIEMLCQEFPAVRLIRNTSNLGYTLPMNQALRQGCGRYLAQLNPDTVVLPEAFDRLVAFMDAHTGVGICGPRVLNRDRTIQKSCRRGEPRPLAVIGYFTGLDRKFPGNRRLGEYQLSYIDDSQTQPVAGVAGSCMLIRRAVIEQIGYLDERYFAFQEDADFCRRARDAGWPVYYLPEAEIVHYGGMGGTRVQPYRSIYEWHRSYFTYYRTHLAKDYFFLFNGLYYLFMLLKLLAALATNALRSEKIAGPKRP